MNDWKEILKEDLESKILREIEKEGGALGMKNLKQFGKEAEIKQALSKLEKEGKVFMHKDGDIYTHEPIKKSPEAFNKLPENLKQEVRNLVYQKNIPFNQALAMVYKKLRQQNKPTQQTKPQKRPNKPGTYGDGEFGRIANRPRVL